MFSVLEALAEQRILEALGRGDFDRLPGMGQPLAIDAPGLVPPEQRMLNTILKNAGCVPEAVTLRREIAALKQRIRVTEPGAQRDALRRELALCLTRLDGRA